MNNSPPSPQSSTRDATRRSLFVNLMYAVVLGSAFPRLVQKGVELGSVQFYAVLFLFVVILEDYFLYEIEIAPFQKPITLSAQAVWALFVEISILVVWYLCVMFVVERFDVFLRLFIAFLLLKFAAGFPHWFATLGWRTVVDRKLWRNLAFVIPVVVALVFLRGRASHAVRWAELVGLSLSWVLMVALWWSVRSRLEP